LAALADEPVAGGGENVGQEINREKGNGGLEVAVPRYNKYKNEKQETFEQSLA